MRRNFNYYNIKCNIISGCSGVRRHLQGSQLLFILFASPVAEMNKRFIQTGNNSTVVNKSLEKYNASVGYNIATSNSLTPFSEQWCKEKKAEIFKNLPAVFEDMSKLKEKNYFATSKVSAKSLSFYNLLGVPGVYMITNKVTKKIYIGMSKNLKARFYNYLDLNRLQRDSSSRIHKALIKYGFNNFSISILELHPNSVKTSLLREREDFFIKVFKPQYNIKRSKFNLDMKIKENYRVKIKTEIPIKVKNLLDASLDPKNLEVNLVTFKTGLDFSYYYFIWTTPKYRIEASSKGWAFGDVVNKSGFNPIPLKSKLEKENIIPFVQSIDLEKLAKFFDSTFNRQMSYSSAEIKSRFKEKIKALKVAAKSKGK